jgi:uncharacterized protein YggE
MISAGSRIQTQAIEGVAVVGEAVRRIEPESAEFLIEITASGPTGSQAIHNHQTRTAQIVQAVSTLGVQRGDLQTVSLNVVNTFSPLMQALPSYGVPQIAQGGYGQQIGQPYGQQIGQGGYGQQIGQGGYGAYGAPAPLQPEVQFGSYQARSVLRVNVREAVRAGDVADILVKTGATLASGLSFRAADEAAVRKSVLEAAGKDARAKAETLAATSGKHIGDPVSITEDMVASNGTYSALRAQIPWAFGPDMPSAAGELEYYARVTANYRFA